MHRRDWTAVRAILDEALRGGRHREDDGLGLLALEPVDSADPRTGRQAGLKQVHIEVVRGDDEYVITPYRVLRRGDRPRADKEGPLALQLRFCSDVGFLC